MAVIRCTLEQGGKLKVVKVLQFQPGDTIELDQPVEVSWNIEGGQTPVIRAFKCMAVLTAFDGTGGIVENLIPIPCPHN